MKNSELTVHRVLVVRNRVGRVLAQFAAASGPDGAGVYEFHARDGGMLASGFTPIPAKWNGCIGLYRGLTAKLALRFKNVKAPNAKIEPASERGPLKLLCGCGVVAACVASQ